MNVLKVSSVSLDRDDEEMNRRDDRREGNRHCKERASKDKVFCAANSLLDPLVKMLENWKGKVTLSKPRYSLYIHIFVQPLSKGGMSNLRPMSSDNYSGVANNTAILSTSSGLCLRLVAASFALLVVQIVCVW